MKDTGNCRCLNEEWIEDSSVGLLHVHRSASIPFCCTKIVVSNFFHSVLSTETNCSLQERVRII